MAVILQVRSSAECPLKLKISSQGERGDLGKRNKHTSEIVQKHLNPDITLQDRQSDVGAEVQLP